MVIGGQALAPRGCPGSPAGHLGDWRWAAASRPTDPEMFFPLRIRESPGTDSQGEGGVGGLPVRRQCLQFALRTRQTHGIWGGLTELERRQGPRPAGRR